MKNVYKSILACVFFVMLSALPLTSAHAVETIGADKLEQLIAQHKGKVIVVNFFATWCPPCREEIPGLVDISKERGKEVVILGLSVDESAKPLPSFIKKYKIPYTVVRANDEIQRLFEVRSIPHNVVFDKNGKIVANESGFVSKKQLNTFIDKL